MLKGYNKPGDVQFLRSYDHNESEVYPHPSVRVVRPGSHTWKYALTKYVLKKRTLYLGITLCVITLLLIIIIAVSVSARNNNVSLSPSGHNRLLHHGQHKFGLLYYPMPADGSNIINYRPGDRQNYSHLLENVTKFLEPYQPDSPIVPGRVDCHSRSDRTSDDSSCQFNIAAKISHYRLLKDTDYCFEESLPCVWLQLKLPFGVTPQGIIAKSKFYSKVRSELGKRYDSDYIGVSCRGQTPDDDHNLMRGTDELISYRPEKGFPLYYFPATNTTHYISPIVVVQFDRIHSNVLVNVKCTAWAVTSQGQLSSMTDLYTTEFTLKVS